MAIPWFWAALGGLTALAVYQQSRIYQIHRKAKDREQLFEIIAENAADMIALVDVKGRRLYNSPAYKRILGYSAAELGGTSSFEQIHSDDRFRVLEAAREARESGIGKRLEYRIKHKDGSWRVLESIASAVRGPDGKVAKLVIVNRDITERKRAEQKLEHNLFHDPLTGLPNRRLFLDRLQHAFVRARRDSTRQYALLLANVDHFKVFNENLGTNGADRVLQEIARRLSAGFRLADTVSVSSGTSRSNAEPAVARLGGDEFTILLENTGDPTDAMRIAQRIQAAVAEPFMMNTYELRPSLTIGIALGMAGHRLAEDILTDANVAMRRAKSLGLSHCEVFDQAMHTRAEGRMRLEADLRAALAGHQFRVFYQPVVRLGRRAIVGFEALLRWEHPTQGLIAPDRFIEAAEDSGILVSIGQWLMLQACLQLREWDKVPLNQQPLTLTVNVSARQFSDARLIHNLQDALRETNVEPSRLQLETTENVAAADPKFTGAVLSQLKQLGVAVVLDDFGIGASSLRGLWQFPIAGLKIDRSLIRDMQTDRTASAIVETILTLAHKMNLQVTAEGIETLRQAERLWELGCPYGQGYHFSQPLDAEGALNFLRQQAVSTHASVAGKS
jgi:diguanylate cyclase (GGDEF)-like protein/PAS domain S-box-containing protein